MKLYNVYPLFDVNIVRGQGCKVWDDKGTEYLDLYGGHAVISIGHCHPQYVHAIEEQVKKLGFYSNSVVNKLQEQLAHSIGKISNYEDYSAFFVNSGAEANENALKLASFHTGRTRVISFEKSFHGRTSLAVEATHNPKIIAPINSNGHTTYIALGDIESVRNELAKGDVAAVIIEGIQGVGGIRVPNEDFLQQLKAECEKNGTILILDEIQSGCGRSGRYFAHQWSNVRPHIITMAKGIGNGFPIGCVLISPMFTPWAGQLGTTFGGNHLACAAAQSVIDVMNSEKLIENAHATGEYLIRELKKIECIKEVRGKGLMIGMEFDKPIKEIRQNLLFKEHVFTGVSGTNVIRLLPPLTLTTDDAKEFISRLKNTIE